MNHTLLIKSKPTVELGNRFVSLANHCHSIPTQLQSLVTQNSSFNSIHVFPRQDTKQLTAKEAEMKKMSDILVELQKKSEEDTKLVKNAQDHFHAVSAGLSSNDDGEDQTLADQLLGMYSFVY